MGRPKRTLRTFEVGQIIIFKSIMGCIKGGYEIVFILEMPTDKKRIRYVFLEIDVSDKGIVYSRRFDYAETTFKQRIRGFSNKAFYEELDKDGAKLEMVVSTGKSLSMVLQEAITGDQKRINNRLDWYNKKIIQEKEQFEKMEQARSLIE